MLLAPCECGTVEIGAHLRCSLYCGYLGIRRGQTPGTCWRNGAERTETRANIPYFPKQRGGWKHRRPHRHCTHHHHDFRLSCPGRPWPKISPATPGLSKLLHEVMPHMARQQPRVGNVPARELQVQRGMTKKLAALAVSMELPS